MTTTPPVVFWQRLYGGAMALLYLLCAIGGIVMLVFRNEIAKSEPADSALFWGAYGLILTGIGLVLFLAFGAALFLPARPWVWVYHLVLIAIGLSSPCCLPVSVPLLIFWLKPETRTYFGRAA